MINKNKFSIKNTKKVLHKVGKQWVVVSAVLLGLVAGGAAVNETANADNIQVAQPQAMAANHSLGASEQDANNTNDPIDKLIPKITNKINNNRVRVANYKNDVESNANVDNLSKLATRANSNSTVANYQDLVSLASNEGLFNNGLKVGSDVSGQTNTNTAFGILNHAESDINALNQGSSANSDLTNISSKLARIQNKASNASDDNISYSMSYPVSSMSLSMSSQISPSTSISYPIVTYNNGSLSSSSKTVEISAASINFNYNVPASSMNAKLTLNIPSLINNPSEALNSFVSNEINSNAVAYASSANLLSDVTNAAKASVADDSSLNTLRSTLNGINNDLINNINNIKEFLQSPKYDSIKQDMNNAENVKNSGLDRSVNHNGIKGTTHISYSQLEAIAKNPSDQQVTVKTMMGSIQVPATSIKGIQQKAQAVVNGVNEAENNPISRALNTLETKQSSLANDLIKFNSNSMDNSINASASSAFNTKLSDMASSATTSIMSNPYVSDIADILNSSVGSYANSGIALNDIYSDLNVNSQVAKIALGTLNHQKDDSKYNKLESGVSDASTILSNVVANPNLSDEYNNLYSDVYNLPSSLAITSDAAPGDGLETHAYNAYESMASDANSLRAGIDSADKNNSVVPHVNNFLNNDIAGQATSLATSMSSESNVIQSASDEVANYINNTKNSSYASNASLYANDIQSMSSVYYNELANGSANASAASVDASNAVSHASYSTNKASVSNPSASSSSASSSSQSSSNGNNSSDNGSNENPFVFPFASSANVMPSGTSTVVPSSSESKKHAANYVKVIKALQLHTSPNFTKRNAVAVVKPGTEIKIEKSVKAHNGALRYEVRYNKKNYFITANKHWVSAYYKAAKHINYRYTKVIKALQLHTSAKFTKRNGVKVVKPGTELRIDNVVKNHGLARYEVRYQGHNYFITANSHFTVNAYLQKSNFSKRGYKAVRAIKPVNEYRHVNFTKRGLVRHFRRGTVLPVRRVLTIGKGEVTRLQLTNGRYVSANKNLVNVIK